jgi:hypothetical protein
MNTLIRIVFNRTFLLLVALGVLIVVNQKWQWVDTSSLWNPTTGGEEQEETDVASETLRGEETVQKTPSTVVQKAPTPVSVSGTSIVFPYTEALRDEPYYVEWWAGNGSVATIRLIPPDGEATVVPGCSSLAVSPGVKKICIWKPGSVDQLKSREGFMLELTTYATNGSVTATTRTKPFTMVTTFTTPLTSHEDEQYGWSIRYPETWTKSATKGRVVIAKDKSSLQNPLASNEALTVEFCSLAREDCESKKEAFLAAASAREGSLGGKRTTMRVIAEGEAYRRTDLVDRNGILYITSVRAVTSDGGMQSPYTRKAFAEFRFEPPRLSAETYSYERSSRSASLVLEYTDTRLTYARLSTQGTGCETTLDTSSFKTAGWDTFAIVRGTCTITGTREGDNFKVSEEKCDDIHTGSCTFEGSYDSE